MRSTGEAATQAAPARSECAIAGLRVPGAASLEDILQGRVLSGSLAAPPATAVAHPRARPARQRRKLRLRARSAQSPACGYPARHRSRTSCRVGSCRARSPRHPRRPSRTLALAAACPAAMSPRRTDAPTHRRTDAPTHRRTDAPTHRRTDAPTHRRTDADSAAGAADRESRGRIDWRGVTGSREGRLRRSRREAGGAASEPDRCDLLPMSSSAAAPRPARRRGCAAEVLNEIPSPRASRQRAQANARGDARDDPRSDAQDDAQPTREAMQAS